MKPFCYPLLLLASIPVSVAGAPPVSYPQACAPTYCVQIIATVPDQPQNFIIRHNATANTSTMTVDMGRGFFIAFSSRPSQVRMSHALGESQWRFSGQSASAWRCLRCDGLRRGSEVLGIAMTGIPSGYDSQQLGLSVCTWPLDMSAAGYGDGRSMGLGEKVCISAHAP